MTALWHMVLAAGAAALASWALTIPAQVWLIHHACRDASPAVRREILDALQMLSISWVFPYLVRIVRAFH